MKPPVKEAPKKAQVQSSAMSAVNDQGTPCSSFLLIKDYMLTSKLIIALCQSST